MLRLVEPVPQVTVKRTTSGWTIFIEPPPQNGLPWWLVFAAREDAIAWAAAAAKTCGGRLHAPDGQEDA